jgi:hypothetical protein
MTRCDVDATGSRMEQFKRTELDQRARVEDQAWSSLFEDDAGIQGAEITEA